MTDEYVIIDVDWLRNIAWPQNDEEENDLIEQVYSVSRENIDFIVRYKNERIQ